jgi:hypothetical protein
MYTTIEDTITQSFSKVDAEIIVLKTEDADILSKYIADFINKNGVKSAEYNKYVKAL